MSRRELGLGLVVAVVINACSGSDTSNVQTSSSDGTPPGAGSAAGGAAAQAGAGPLVGTAGAGADAPGAAASEAGADDSAGAAGASESGSSSSQAGSGGATALIGSGGASALAGSAGANNGPHVVGACGNLGAANAWQNITPPSLGYASWCVPGSDACSAAGAISTYGAHGLAIDPNDSGTLYLGTDSLGFWKTTDCGATWLKVDTGAHQKELDSGRNWTIVVDPSDSKVIYTTPGYGAEGLYKSVNGGVDWQQMFTDDILPSLPYGGFIETIAIDPANPQHLVVSFHIDCTGSPTDGGNWACLAVTPDGGKSWTLTKSAVSWGEGDGQTVIDDKTWFFGDGTGIWRTTTAGNSWDKVYSGQASGHVFSGADGKLYAAGSPMAQSSDGVHWSPLADSPSGSSVNGSNPIASDGKRLFTSGGQYGGGEPSVGWYASAPLSAPDSWTPIFEPAPMVFGGSTLIYDPDHHLLYSANLTGGLWRVVVP